MYLCKTCFAFRKDIKENFYPTKMAEHALRSIARMADVLAEKGVIGVKEGDDAAVPDDDVLIRAINRRRERRFNSLYLLGRFPFVGTVHMDDVCISIMQTLCGVHCSEWKIFYGTLSRAPILVDSKTGVYFKCFDEHHEVVALFSRSDDMQCTSIIVQENVFGINFSNSSLIYFNKDPRSLVP